MKIVPLTVEEKQKIYKFAQKILEDAKINPNSNWKIRKNYSIESICIGTAGEFAYGKMNGLKVNLKVIETGDGGIDFLDGAQIKTVTYNGPGKKELKLSRLYTSKIPKKLVLAHYDMMNKSDFVTLIGEISYDSFLNKKRKKFYNGRVAYVVDEDNLDTYYK